MLDFLHITALDIVDILLVAVIFFYVFRLIKGSQAIRIFFAIVSLYVLRIIAEAFDMKLISGMLGMVLDVGMIAVIVIFQPEIRRFLARMGQGRGFRDLSGRLFRIGRKSGESYETINEICLACEDMSAQRCGALIVIQRNTSLRYIEETGDSIDASVSKRLLMNLFFKNSPLHDGAVTIHSGRVVAARCTLPISQSPVPPSFGMRHKAAMGISEETDALVVVVSEETGGISLIQDGKAERMQNINDLKLALQKGLEQSSKEK